MTDKMTKAAQRPTAPSTRTVILRQALQKTFLMGDSPVTVLKHVDLSLQAGEFVAIEGRSGSGKSTLLHLMGAADAPDSGSIIYQDRNLAALSSAQRSRVRNTQFGFVFQFYHLLPELNVLENTLLAPLIENSWFSFRSKKAELRDRAAALLAKLGLGHRLEHRPNQL